MHFSESSRLFLLYYTSGICFSDKFLMGLWQIGILKKELESVRKHRKQYRSRRLSVPVPVVSLVSFYNYIEAIYSLGDL